MPKISKTYWRRKKKQLYGREHYKNLSEDENQKLVEYRKKCYRKRKNTIIKGNDLESSFEAYLNKNFESVYKNR